MISIRTINPVAHSITQMLPMWLLILSWYMSFSVVIVGTPGYPGSLGVLELSCVWIEIHSVVIML